jgi:hypothetical protein
MTGESSKTSLFRAGDFAYVRTLGTTGFIKALTKGLGVVSGLEL